MCRVAFVTPASLSQRTYPCLENPRRSRPLHLSRPPKMTASNDLLIIGAGDLGSRVARLWRASHPGAEIVAETRTNASHSALSSMSVTPILAGTQTQCFQNVVFCVPLPAISDYSDAVATATKRVLPSGRLVFTSSTAVYGNANFANEHSPITDEGRAKKLFHAEKATLAIPGGVVVRLPGLYHLERGPHMQWFSQGSVPAPVEIMMNFIHYDDAANVVTRALLVDGLTERVLLATAEKVITKRDFVDSALRHPRFAETQRPQFLNDAPVPGQWKFRAYDNSLTRRVLKWKPRFETIAEFVEAELRTYSKNRD